MKICKDCGEKKVLSDFYPTQGECKKCTCDRVKKNRLLHKKYYDIYDQKRNRENYRLMCLRKYSMMRCRVLGTSSHWCSSEGKELLSKEEFLQWAKENEQLFRKIQNIWKKSGYKKSLAPSIDRINNSVGYARENLQWLPLWQNLKKDNTGEGWQKIPRNNKGQFIKIQNINNN